MLIWTANAGEPLAGAGISRSRRHVQRSAFARRVRWPVPPFVTKRRGLRSLERASDPAPRRRPVPRIRSRSAREAFRMRDPRRPTSLGGPIVRATCVGDRDRTRLPASAANWPQWRGQGARAFRRTQAAARVGPGKNVAWKVELPGTGHSSPIVWGDRIFVTAVVEGAVVPGARSGRAHHGREGLRASRQRCGRRRTRQGAGARREDRQDALGSHGLRGPGLRRPPSSQQLRRADAGDRRRRVYAYFGPEGLYAYDFAGKLAWKAVEKFKTLGLGTGTSPVLSGTW